MGIYSISCMGGKITTQHCFQYQICCMGSGKISFLNIKAYCQLNFKNYKIYSFFSGKILASIKKVFHNSSELSKHNDCHCFEFFCYTCIPLYNFLKIKIVCVHLFFPTKHNFNKDITKLYFTLSCFSLNHWQPHHSLLGCNQIFLILRLSR